MIMERCRVEGCIAGLSNTTKSGQTSTAKQNLLFKAPTDPHLLAKWCKNLGQKIKPGDKVCEFHFKENDILRNLSTFSKVEGCKSLTFRKRCSLKQGALPSPITVRRDSLEVQNPSNEENGQADFITLEEGESHNPDDWIIEMANGETEENSNSNEGSDDVYSEQSTEQYQKQSIGDQNRSKQAGEQRIIRISPQDDPLWLEPKQEHADEKVVANYVKNGLVIKRVIQSSPPNSVNNQVQKTSQKRKSSNVSSKQNKLSKPCINSAKACNSTENVVNFRFPYSPVKRFEDIDELKFIIQHRCIRPHWCAKAEERSVLFSHVDFDLSRINCCLKIAEDFTVNASTSDKIIAIYVTDNVSCVNEIIEIMKVLEKKRWCLGPGIPLVNRAPDCIGAMPVKTVSDSCAACLREKANAGSHTRELTNTKIKLDETRHKCELWRKKHHYATTQYDRLKAENKILEYQVDEAKKIAINEVLNRLAPLQKLAVRYIINSSYTAKNAMRYNTNWINECIVIRAMSPAVYEYIRQKEMLPFPCPDTLKKHKFKIILDKDPNEPESDDSFDYSTLPESPEVAQDPLELAPKSEVDTAVGDLLASQMPEGTMIFDPAEVPESTMIFEAKVVPESTMIFEAKEVPETTMIFEAKEVPESTMIFDATEVCESTEIVVANCPESTEPNAYNGILDFSQECVIADDVAYEVTVCSETVEGEQY